MLAPMPLYAFLQAATSYQDSRLSSYDTRRLGGPLVFFPLAPPGALLHFLSPEAAPSTIASLPSARFLATRPCGRRHLGFRRSALGTRTSAPLHSAFGIGIRHSAHGTSSPARLPPRPRSPARSHRYHNSRVRRWPAAASWHGSTASDLLAPNTTHASAGCIT